MPHSKALNSGQGGRGYPWYDGEQAGEFKPAERAQLMIAREIRAIQHHQAWSGIVSLGRQNLLSPRPNHTINQPQNDLQPKKL